MDNAVFWGILPMFLFISGMMGPPGMMGGPMGFPPMGFRPGMGPPRHGGPGGPPWGGPGGPHGGPGMRPPMSM